MAIERHIFAIGDNGFRKNQNISELHHYLLAQTKVARPRVCVIPTASGDAQDYLDAFYSTFQKYDCTVSHLSLFRDHPEPIEPFLLEQNLIYVGGGNTRNLLLLWRDWGLDRILRKAYEQGVVLAGGSAGSICWFEGGVTDSIPGKLSALKNGLGFLAGSNCPHYDFEVNRRPAYHALLQAGELGPGYAADEGVALHFVNETFKEAISPFANKNAFQLRTHSSAAGVRVEETAIPARSLPKNTAKIVS
jgi:dipeptidase E